MKYIRRFSLAGALALPLYFITCIILFTINSYRENSSNSWLSTTPRVQNYTLCEHIYPNLIREPLNTVTAMLFTFTYVYPLFYGIQDKYEHVNTILSHNPDFSILIGTISLFHFLGTVLNHMCSCNIGLILDNSFAWIMFGIYFLVPFKIHTSIPRIIIYIVFLVYSVIIGLIAIFNEYIIIQNIISVILIVLVMLINIFFSYKDSNVITKRRYLWTSFSLGVIGLILAAFDEYMCYKNVFGAHSIFHVLGSASIWCLYMYLWTMKTRPE